MIPITAHPTVMPPAARLFVRLPSSGERVS